MTRISPRHFGGIGSVLVFAILASVLLMRAQEPSAAPGRTYGAIHIHGELLCSVSPAITPQPY